MATGRFKGPAWPDVALEYKAEGLSDCSCMKELFIILDKSSNINGPERPGRYAKKIRKMMPVRAKKYFASVCLLYMVK